MHDETLTYSGDYLYATGVYGKDKYYNGRWITVLKSRKNSKSHSVLVSDWLYV